MGCRKIVNSKSSIVNKRAFTLIELLVVIAIIALLMAILVPVLRSARNQARSVVCQANLKQWGTISTLYAEDNQGRLPEKGGDALWFVRGSALRDDDPNRPSLYQDINAKGIACCPMATKPRSNEKATGIQAGFDSSPYQIRGNVGSTFQAWEITSPRPRFRCSYGFNVYLFHDLFDSSYNYNDTYSIKGSAKVPLLLDSTAPIIPFLEFTKPRQNEQDGSGFIINRHNGYVNGLFLDWSVRKVGLKELWTLKWNKQFDTAGPWTKAGGVQPEDWPPWMRNFKDY